MRVLRTKFQAIKKYFRRPHQISEAEADPFPLLELPPLVLRKIFCNLGVLTLIDFLMTSDKFSEKMKEIKLPADLFTWELTKERMQIFCAFGESVFTLECNHEDPTGPVVERRIGGKTRLVKRSRARHLAYYEFKLSDRSEDEFHITSHLLDIIKPKKYNLHLNKDRNFKDLFVWKFSKNFDQIRLMPDYATDLFGPSEVKFLFQDVAVKTIRIEFETRPELLDITRTMKLRNAIQKITVHDLNLFSAENIINSKIKSFSVRYDNGGSYGYMNGKRFKFYGQFNKPLFYKELNKIMKAWQEGEKLTQLKKIEIPWEGVSDEELRSLLEGIDLVSERSNRRQFVEDHRYFISRKTDGKFAYFTRHYDDFKFSVWN